jgi:hypothetical protein
LIWLRAIDATSSSPLPTLSTKHGCWSPSTIEDKNLNKKKLNPHFEQMKVDETL